MDFAIADSDRKNRIEGDRDHSLPGKTPAANDELVRVVSVEAVSKALEDPEHVPISSYNAEPPRLREKVSEIARISKRTGILVPGGLRFLHHSRRA
jgi:hypothetical protein